MLSSEALSARRARLRTRAVSLKPCSVVVVRDGATLVAQTARINYPSAGSSHQQSEATDAAVIAFTITSDDPSFDVQREDRVIVVDAQTAQRRTGRVLSVRREPWGVEADATEEQ